MINVPFAIGYLHYLLVLEWCRNSQSRGINKISLRQNRNDKD
jgi:hypothetical protein